MFPYINRKLYFDVKLEFFVQELLSKQHEMKRVKTQLERLEAQLQTETKIRTDLENRNTALEQDISKVYTRKKIFLKVFILCFSEQSCNDKTI